MISPALALFILGQLLKLVVGLQVTPNSACSKLCVNDATTDISNSNSSSLNSTDTVCSDDAYTNTATGQKFQNCVNCLQNSTSNTATESDQEWFLYNIRFAFNTCLFNPNASLETFSSPCSSSTTCGPLASALQVGILEPSLANQFSYCGNNNETFGSINFRSCATCLKQNSEQHYLANILTTLDAGCVQRPSLGVPLRLDGSVFSSSYINMTFLSNATTTTTNKNKGLTIGAVIGIAIGGVVLSFAFLALILFCCRKRMRQRDVLIESSLDQRYGNKDISNPVYGGFAAYSEASPDTPTMKDNIGLIKTPAPVKKSVLHSRYNPPDYEERYSRRDPSPSSQNSLGKTHEEIARDLGFSMGIQDPRVPRVETKVVPMLYQPEASEQKPYEVSPMSTRENTPDFVRSTFTTNLDQPPSASSTARSPVTVLGSPNLSPSSGPGLPSLPKRSPSFSGHSSTSKAFSRGSSRRHKRDLSVSRGEAGALSTVGRAMKPGQISGPIVNVRTRYEDEDEDAKRRRERNFRDGFTKRQEDANRKTGNYESDAELW